MLQHAMTYVDDCRDAETQSNKVLRKLTQVQLAVTEICGRARNSYSKGVLKKDFRDGLLEMEETAADVERDAGGEPLHSLHACQAGNSNPGGCLIGCCLPSHVNLASPAQRVVKAVCEVCVASTCVVRGAACKVWLVNEE